jgi:hypothetical protein
MTRKSTKHLKSKPIDKTMGVMEKLTFQRDIEINYDGTAWTFGGP